MNTNQPAIVFGLFETGLGVARSLGQKGIKVIGIDFKKDIAWYSRYVKPMMCPHPLRQEEEFIYWIHNNFSDSNKKIPVFLTSDDFLISFSRNSALLSKYFLFNLADHSLLESISDKYSQFKLALETGINLPSTWLITNQSDFKNLPEIHYPLFIKGQDVNSWRKEIGGTVKGFLVKDYENLNEKVKDLIDRNVSVILQEVIEGPDTNHYKYCSYTTSKGKVLAEFTLQKIRQNPIHFGVGSVVQSIHKQELIEAGRKLFSAIGFKGIGSVEFKFDNRDHKLKMIEINPRYWQQNYLSTACGINFPYLNYLDLLNSSPQPVIHFKPGIKWVNRYMDFDSFIKYRREGTLSFMKWQKSLKGKKTYADFTWDDPVPFLYEFGFGLKMFRVPSFLWKKLLS